MVTGAGISWGCRLGLRRPPGPAPWMPGLGKAISGAGGIQGERLGEQLGERLGERLGDLGGLGRGGGMVWVEKAPGLKVGDRSPGERMPGSGGPWLTSRGRVWGGRDRTGFSGLLRGASGRALKEGEIRGSGGAWIKDGVPAGLDV